MWQKGWREQAWSSLSDPFDIIIVGGGITGAGILREAARARLRVLLVEQGDFASGTSSRSSKLVHGGLRYLKNAQVKLTIESVRERERLLHEGRGLVSQLCFLAPSYRRDPMPGWLFGAGLALYDLLALKWGHRRYDSYDLRDLCPALCDDGLTGGFRYFDAQTDDARLVLRILQEAVQGGGLALNYTRAASLLRTRNGDVTGVVLGDETPENAGRTMEARASVVINASGAWADELRQQVGARPRLRKLRGSHMVFPAARLPLSRAVSFWHPVDGRAVFAFPWEGVVLIGTTDVDHSEPLTGDPAIGPAEAEYLLQAARTVFPAQELCMEDVQATFSGVRPVIGTGKADPSKESREHVLWSEAGLLTVAGGKLTTFRLMAHAALKAASARLPELKLSRSSRMLDDPSASGEEPETKLSRADAVQADHRLHAAARLRLLGRYGADAQTLLSQAEPGEEEAIPGTQSLWAELRWVACSEAAVHLDDILLRRVRLGLLLPEGGLPWMERIRTIVQPALGWDDARWSSEAAGYASLWKRCYHFG